jgi:hypothetical protein
MKALFNFSVKNGKVDLNGSCLYSDGKTQRGICHLTDMGYKSKKSLFVDFVTPLRIEVLNGKQYVRLTDSEYSELMKLPNPSDTNIKVWNKWTGDDKATAILELCKRMNDPYDRG